MNGLAYLLEHLGEARLAATPHLRERALQVGQVGSSHGLQRVRAAQAAVSLPLRMKLLASCSGNAGSAGHQQEIEVCLEQAS